MFKSDFLESLSKVHFLVPVFIFVPVIIYFIYGAFQNNIGIVTFIEMFITGLIVWTLVEYVMHRFLFHYMPPDKPWAQRLHFIFHGVHHDYPSDAKRLVLPPSVSIPLALAFYLMFNAILPVNYIYGFFPAFLIGYLFYDESHYAIHHFNFKGKIWKKIKQHHMLHHYSDPAKGYGVSSPLWDKIFGSDFINK